MFGFKIVPQAYAIIIERLGKFHRVSYSGLRFVIPFIEKIRPVFSRSLETDVDGIRKIVTKRSEMVDLREQVLDFPRQRLKQSLTLKIRWGARQRNI